MPSKNQNKVAISTGKNWKKQPKTRFLSQNWPFPIFLDFLTSKKSTASNFFLNGLKLFWRVLWGTWHSEKIFWTTLSVFQKFYDFVKIHDVQKWLKMAYFCPFLGMLTTKKSTASNFFLNGLKLFWRVLWATRHTEKIFLTTLSVFPKIYDILKIAGDS